MDAEIWASIGIAIATLLLVVIPVIVYAAYALEDWIGDRDGYDPVVAAVQRGEYTPLRVR